MRSLQLFRYLGIVVAFTATTTPVVLAQQSMCRDCPFPLADKYPDPVIPLLLNQPLRETASHFALNDESAADKIVQIETCLLSYPVPALMIMAIGQFSGSGWEGAQLSQVHFAPPEGGYYEFQMLGTRGEPNDNLTNSYLHAISIWPGIMMPDDLAGVRIKDKNGGSLEKVMPAEIGCGPPPS